MSRRERVEALFRQWVERHVVAGERMELERLCAGESELLPEVRRLVERYGALDATLDMPAAPVEEEASTAAPLPSFEGFRTMERIGSGGGGEVYKLEDLELGRTVAAKVVRRDGSLQASLAEFVQEARSLALFEDPRIVRIFEFRSRADPPVLLMEYVDGFRLDRIAPSLEYPQRARLMAEICDAVHHAHSLGLQHRDLKPANILVDSRLAPKILDLGLSSGSPHAGHGRGTPAYMPPEQLEPGRPIDARSDVYALGVVLYEMLCGTQPHAADSLQGLLDAIRAGAPRLPVEVQPDVPEPLQAIALKAMEAEPGERYASTRDMAQDLRRYLDGRPVLARPSVYRSALGRRIGPHLQQVREWLRLKLIYPHEARRLERVYADLELHDDDWIVRSRMLSVQQISLYLGALLLLCGGLLYFVTYQNGGVSGWLQPTAVLALPFVAVNGLALRLWRGERRPVAVAFHLASLMLLPLWLLIVFQEAGWWPAGPGPDELFGEGLVSNRQLQIALLAGAIWSCLPALRTRTLTLATAFTVLATLLHLALLADLGLVTWITESRLDLLAIRLVPLLLVAAAAGFVAERRRLGFFARPFYVAAALSFAVVLELLALDGRAFAYLGLSAAPLGGAEVSDPLLLDTLAAMTLNGLLIYAAAWILERRGTPLMSTPAWLLFLVSPFAILEPVAYLNFTGEYALRYAWLYLALALAIAFFSRFHQRKSFYYAGLLNTGAALWYVTKLNDWWDRPAWGIAVALAGVGLLAIGLALRGVNTNGAAG